jgi:prepilin signal peptidase PulO-like enzyme (type II secretory pathway)
MVILILIVLGICLGSFVNAFVWRHYRQMELQEQIEELQAKKGSKKKLVTLRQERSKLSVSRGRSMCTHCEHPLKAKDLIPVISFVMLRGRCRYCGERIEDTPLAELLTPLLFAVSYIFWPLQFHSAGLFTFVIWIVFLTGFVALILYDLRWFLLPHSIVLPLIGLAVLQVLIVTFGYDEGVQYLASALWGALIIGGVFFALYRISNEKWIGGGDVTLGLLLGLLVGGPAKALLLIFVASLLGTLVALPLLAAKKAKRNTHLPFGPFLIIAAVVVVLWGAPLIDWYTNLYSI